MSGLWSKETPFSDVFNILSLCVLTGAHVPRPQWARRLEGDFQDLVGPRVVEAGSLSFLWLLPLEFCHQVPGPTARTEPGLPGLYRTRTFTR